jgi:protocatechuate 3,4-dioxygenase beta subunit
MFAPRFRFRACVLPSGEISRKPRFFRRAHPEGITLSSNTPAPALTRRARAEHTKNARRRGIAIATVSALAAGLLVAGGVVTAANAQSGKVNGVAFRDYNQNGQFDPTGTDGLSDVGVVGVRAQAFAADGTLVGTATTSATGAYSIPISASLADGSPVRVQFDQFPTGFFDSFALSTAGANGSSVQFTTVGAENVNVGLHTLNDFSRGTATPVVTAVMANGAATTSRASSAKSLSALLPSTTNSLHTQQPTAATTITTFNETGALWGTAIDDLGNNRFRIYATATVKRHSGFGPRGIAGLYSVDVTTNAAGQVTRVANSLQSYDLASTGVSFGSVTRDLAEQGANDFGTADYAAYAAAGKAGIGGIALVDGRLYVVNLQDRKIYSYDTANLTAAPTAIDITGLGANERPWALSARDGALYVGVTDTTDVTKGARVLRAALGTSAPAFAEVLQVPLTYDRGVAWHKDDPVATAGQAVTKWHPWTDDPNVVYTSGDFTSAAATGFRIATFRAWAQPILSSLAFDDGGNVVVSLTDRLSLQGGQNNLWQGRPTNDRITAISAGDTLYAGRGDNGRFVLESNGSVQLRDAGNNAVTRVRSLGSTVAAGQTARQNTQGPGGREFFEDSVGWDGRGGFQSGEGVVHDETSLGAATTLPGQDLLASVAYDPATQYNVGGNRFTRLSTGESLDGFNQYPAFSATYFEKAGGIGSVAAVLPDPPVQIGNRVWLDADRDGIQDANEPGIAGVTVELLRADGTQLIASTTTNAAGEWYFSSTTTPALAPNTDYMVQVTRPSGAVTLGGNAANAFPGLQGSELVFTTPDVAGASDLLDSDVTRVGSGAAARKVIRTGAAGVNDHSIDAGFIRKTYALGDRVWLDENPSVPGIQSTDKNGIQDPGEPGLAGVTVTLRNASGTVVGTRTTDANGLYVFDELPAGSYTLEFATPAGYYRTAADAGNDTTDSDAATTGANPGRTTTIFLGDGSVDASYTPGVSFTATQGINPRWDAGFVTYTPSLTVKKTDAAGADADTADTAVDLAASNGSTQIRATLTNTGDEPLVNIRLTDAQGQNSSGTVTAFTCTPTGGSAVTLPWAGPLAPGATVDCVATLSGVTPGSAHLDTVTVTATGAVSGTTVSDDDPFHATSRTYAVGDRVWRDVNGNGRQDDTAAESGVAGATVTLLDANGARIAQTTTDVDGRYLFDGLPAGDYRVRFTLPAGLTFTTADANGVETDRNSDAVRDAQNRLVGLTKPFRLDGSSTLTPSGDYTGLPATASEGVDGTWDAGVIADSVSVGDFVWLDANRNGIQDAGELGIPGVQLTIVGPNGAAVTGTNGEPVGPATTDGSGAYLFERLPLLADGQSYTVRLDASGQTALAGYRPTASGRGDADVDSSTGSAKTVASLTTDGASDLTLDFGFVGRTYALGDEVWRDADKDGIRDGDESPLAGVTVTLLDADGEPVTGVDPQVTGTDGRYLFDNLPAGTYAVRFELSAADAVTSQFTRAVAGSDASVDSDARVGTNPAIAETAPITLNDANTALTTDYTSAVSATEGIDPTWDAGVIVKSVSVGDRVWRDDDRDGIQDAGEPGIQGVVIELLGADGRPVLGADGAPLTRTTDADGAYLFDGLAALPAGSHYTVRVDEKASATVLAGFVPAPSGQGGDRGADSSTGSAESGDLTTDGASDRTLDFGFMVKTYAIGDVVWIDRDGDGLFGAGEQTLPGVTVSLTDAGGAPVKDALGSDVQPRTTGADGRYVFDQLPAGQYIVQFTLSDAQKLQYRFTVRDAGDADDRDSDVSANGRTGVITLSDANTALTTTYQPAVAASQGIDPTVDAGVIANAVTVGDFVWVDKDEDGIQDAGEPGLGGVVLMIEGPDGKPVTDVRGATVAPVVTNAEGAYSFTGLPTLAQGQSYTVRIDTDDPRTIAALAGYRPSPVVDGGTGANDSSDGSAVSQKPLDTNGASDDTLDFGFIAKSVSVGDRVFDDVDRDGVQGDRDRGLPGVVVTLTGPNGAAVTDVFGAPVGPATSNADGAYSFENLPPLPAGQSYTVTVDTEASKAALAGYTPTKTGAGDAATDSSTGSAKSGDLTADGDRDDTLDFGFVTRSYALGDRVWIDRNENGIQDAGERSLADVTVSLQKATGGDVTDVKGATVASVTTDEDGEYVFDALPAGDYRVVFTLPTGYKFTAAQQGSADGSDSDAATDGRTRVITLGDASPLVSRDGLSATQGIDPTWDAGVVPLKVSVGDYVWVDTDGDGIQDEGEKGLPGVWLTITGPDGAAVTDVFGSPVGAVRTDGNGAYLFENLPPLPAGKSYTVAIDTTRSAEVLTVFTPSPAGVGNDRGADSSTGSAKSGDLTTDGASDKSIDFGFTPFGPAITVVKADEEGRDANTADTAADLTTANGKTTLVFTVRNTGNEPLTNISLSDVVTGSATVGAIDCAFPGGSGGSSWSGPLAAGASVECTATLTGVEPGQSHRDVVTVTAQGRFTGTPVKATDEYRATSAPRVSVGDFVWVDTDGDGIQDAGEPGLAGVWVTLEGPNGATVTDVFGKTVGPVQTDANGAYSFGSLPVLGAGEGYTVRIDTTRSADVLAPYFPTTAGAGEDRAKDSSTGSATSGALRNQGDSDTGLDFGWRPRTYAVGDVVFVDADRDGIQGPGDAPLAGVAVSLLKADGTRIAGTRTDADGRYLFDELPAGEYRVRVELTEAQQALYRFTVRDAGNDGSDSDVDPATGTTDVFTLGRGTVTTQYEAQPVRATEGIDPTRDAGVIARTYAIGDLVWNDLNGNGVQDAGEPALPGVTVTLYDADGKVVKTTTTDAGGRYLFDDLAPGRYQVGVDVPAGYQVSPQGATDPARDSSVSVTDGRSPVFEVGTGNTAVDGTYADQPFGASEGVDPTWDIGLVALTYAIGDQVWYDTDNDGVRDAGERPAPGIGVILRDAAGLELRRTTTDADGRYLFDALPAGDYAVQFVLPADVAATHRFTQPLRGGDAAMDSDATASGLTRTFTLGAGSASVTTAYDLQAVRATGGIDPTIDAGLVVIPPPLAVTGGTVALLAGVLGALMVVLGGLIIAVRRRRTA